MVSRNPFKPTAGKNPPQLIGRASLLDDFMESVEDGPGAPGRLSIFTGPRGVGKTVMLNAVGNLLQQEHQWLVINETATPGFLSRLSRYAVRLGDELKPNPGLRLSSVTVPVLGGGLGFSPADSERPTVELRDCLTALLNIAEAGGTGVLISIDEVHASNRGELVHLAAVAQHLIREEREFALILAGLPHAVDELLNNNLTTFLRRADRHVLEDVPLDDVSEAFTTTIRENGRRITPEALRTTVGATGGYPFMIQLVGYHVWRRTTGDVITADAAASGIEQARTRLGSLVHGPALKDLSNVDRTFLLAMSQDDGVSRMADIANRLGRSPQYVGQYRSRLLAAGLIEPAGYGSVDFALPFLREYLRENASRLAVAGGRQLL